MADLRTGTQIGGQIAWNAGNLRLRPTDQKLFYKDTELISNIGGQTINGGLTTTGDIVSLNPVSGNGLRLTNANYGAFMRVYNATAYLLSTTSGNQLGTYSSYRPFAWNMSNGQVTISGDSSTRSTIFGGQIDIGASTPSAVNHATRKDYVDQQVQNAIDSANANTASKDALAVHLAGAETITGVKTFSALPVSSVAPTSGTQFVNKTYADQQDALKVAKSGDTMTGDLGWTQYGNASIGNGTGDGVDSKIANLQLKSWFGIGFAPSIAGQNVPLGENAVWIDVRNGYLTARDTIIANNQIRTNSLVTSGTTTFGGPVSIGQQELRGNRNSIIMRDHGAGDVTISGSIGTSGYIGDVYLGHNDPVAGYNTRRVRLRTDLVNADNTWAFLEAASGKVNANNLFVSGTITKTGTGDVIIADQKGVPHRELQIYNIDGNANFRSDLNADSDALGSFTFHSNRLVSTGEIVTNTSANSYRSVYGDYGTFWHQNGSDLYLMLTNMGDQYGTFNNLRPLTVRLTDGVVSLANGATISNGLTVNGAVNMSGTLTVAGGINAGINGNASTASTWQTARTLTVGNTGKSVNGSANVSWSLAEIGALPLTGGTLSGSLNANAGISTTTLSASSEINISKSSGTSTLNINTDAASSGGIIFKENGTNKWWAGRAGANFLIGRYNASGVWINAPIEISYSDGTTTFNGDVSGISFKTNHPGTASTNPSSYGFYAYKNGNTDHYGINLLDIKSQLGLTRDQWATNIVTALSGDSERHIAFTSKTGTAGTSADYTLLGKMSASDKSLTMYGEIRSTSANSYRSVYGNYGTFWRQDGNHLYLMVTNSGNQYGSYNDLRPFRVSLANGAVNNETGFTSNAIAVTGNITFTSSSTQKINYNGFGVANKQVVAATSDNRAYFGNPSLTETYIESGSGDGFKVNVAGTTYTGWHSGNLTPNRMNAAFAGNQVNWGNASGNITTADFITMLNNNGAFTSGAYWYRKGSWSYAGNKTINDTGCGDIQLAGATVEVFNSLTTSGGQYMVRIMTANTGGGVLGATFVYVNHGDAYSPGWRREYSTRNKPNAGDVGAYTIAQVDAAFSTNNSAHNTFATQINGLESNKVNRAGDTITGQLSVNRVISNGSGNDYHTGAFEARGGGSGNSGVYPTIGFHQPGLFAGSIQQRNGTEFWFMRQGNSDRASVIADTVNAYHFYTSGGRVSAGYDSGIAGTVACSNWFRSSGNTGWHNDSHGGGIYMKDAKYVRTTDAQCFHVQNDAEDAISTNGWVRGGKFRGYGNNDTFVEANGGWLYLNWQSGSRTVFGNGAGTQIAYVQSDGLFYTNGNGNFNDVYIRSDIRLKSGFETITSALDKVDQLTGFTYDKKKSLDSTETAREAGIIANELQKVLPEAVMADGEDELLTVSNSAVNALLINAIKELTARVKQLEAMLQ